MGLAKSWDDFLCLLYPRTCPGCGSDNLGKEQMLCWPCTSELPRTHFEKLRGNLVEDLFVGRIPLQMATAHFFFAKSSIVQHLIHRVKYKGNQELGIHLGELMGSAMLQAGWHETVDVIIPLPLNKKKESQRGFNQAALLAKGISKVLGKPMADVAVARNKHTETQTKKTREQRWDNVSDVFDLVDSHDLENKHILLVDDVVTTGATLEACGQVLIKIPGLRLSLATLAFASKI